MIKHFCDLCGTEITHENIIGVSGDRVFMRTRIKRPLSSDLVIDVTVAMDDPSASEGPLDVCVRCVIDAVAKLDNRT